MATLVCGVISFMWLYFVCQPLLIRVCVKKKEKRKKRKKKEKKVIYIFHYIILHGARVCTRHLVTLSIYDGESLYVSSPLSHMCDI